MSVFEMAKKYYPRLWGPERIKALVRAGRLNQDQLDEIIGTVSNLDTAEAGGG